MRRSATRPRCEVAVATSRLSSFYRQVPTDAHHYTVVAPTGVQGVDRRVRLALLHGLGRERWRARRTEDPPVWLGWPASTGHPSPDVCVDRRSLLALYLYIGVTVDRRVLPTVKRADINSLEVCLPGVKLLISLVFKGVHVGPPLPPSHSQDVSTIPHKCRSRARLPSWPRP